jgi:L-lysine 6-transaminase
MLAALTNPSNSDIYTEQYAQFVETFGRVGIPDYLPHAFFIAGGSLAIENALKVAMDWKVQKNFAKGHTTEKGFKVITFRERFSRPLGYTLSLNQHPAGKNKMVRQIRLAEGIAAGNPFPADTIIILKTLKIAKQNLSPR